MNFFDRLVNGWKITINSFKILKANKELIVFPILSGISMILIMGSFVTAFIASAGWDFEYFEDQSTTTTYLIVFLFYLVNYFIVVFFNMALVHCTRLYFQGEEVNIGKGLKFSLSRIGAIFAWAVFAATIGTILRIIQENFGWLGKIIAGLIGIVWSVATFFVVPIIAYENKGPIDAFKRSSQLMKEKWGESIGASFSVGIIQLIAILGVLVVAFVIGSVVHVFAGVAIAILGILLVAAVMSAIETIFISAVYHNITNAPSKHFNEQMVESLFVQK